MPIHLASEVPAEARGRTGRWDRALWNLEACGRGRQYKRPKRMKSLVVEMVQKWSVG